MTELIYRFNRAQLGNTIEQGIDLFSEYYGVHGYEPLRARSAAALEILEGLDAEHELATHEGRAYTGQLQPDIVGEEPLYTADQVRAAAMRAVELVLSGEFYTDISAVADALRDLRAGKLPDPGPEDFS